MIPWSQQDLMRLNQLKNGLAQADQQVANGELSAEDGAQYGRMIGPQLQQLERRQQEAKEHAMQEQEHMAMRQHAMQTTFAQQAAMSHAGKIDGMTGVVFNPHSGALERMTPEFHANGQLKGFSPVPFAAHQAEQEAMPEEASDGP